MCSRPLLRIATLVVDDRPDRDSRPPFFGAAPTALLQGFEALDHRETEIHVISCTKSTMPAPLKLADNIFYHQVVLPHWTYLRSLHAGPVFGVRHILRKIRPDIVHAHGVERWCGLAGCLSGFPAVLTIHGQLRLILQKVKMSPVFYWRLQMILGEWSIKRYKAVICISSHIKNSVSGGSRKNYLVPNALRQEFLSMPKVTAITNYSRAHILVIGTITENKRPLELLDMLFSLHRSGFPFHVRFIGSLNEKDSYGAAFAAMLRVAALSGFADHVSHLDSQSIIHEMDNAHALVHFPLEEAFGLVVAEALARELRVFASKVGGIQDIVNLVPGVELYPPNDFQQLCKGLQRWMLAGHPKLDGAAKFMKSRYSPRSIAKDTVAVYQHVLAQTTTHQ